MRVEVAVVACAYVVYLYRELFKELARERIYIRRQLHHSGEEMLVLSRPIRVRACGVLSDA